MGKRDGHSLAETTEANISDPFQSSADIEPSGLNPPWVEMYTRLGIYALIAGAILFVFSFFTNPVPDPSFPWATLPASLRTPMQQPRSEHWPITYTLAIWLWVFFFPALFFKGYQELGRSDRSAARIWMIMLPTLAMVAWTTYCRFFWPKLYPPTWNAPAYTFICWLYCATYIPVWSNIAFAVTGIGLTANLLVLRRAESANSLLVIFGVLSLPLGLPALVEARRRFDESASGKRQ